MKKIALIILLCFVSGCRDNTITSGSDAVFITESPNSDKVLSEGNYIGFTVDKKMRNVALLKVSAKGLTPKELVMPFSAEGVEHLLSMLQTTETEDGQITPLDTIKNNRGDYLTCAILENDTSDDAYVMCEMNGTALNDSSKRRSIFFTIDYYILNFIASQAVEDTRGNGM